MRAQQSTSANSVISSALVASASGIAKTGSRAARAASRSTAEKLICNAGSQNVCEVSGTGIRFMMPLAKCIMIMRLQRASALRSPGMPAVRDFPPFDPSSFAHHATVL